MWIEPAHCPACHAIVLVTTKGLAWTHRIEGQVCEGSKLEVYPRTPAERLLDPAVRALTEFELMRGARAVLGAHGASAEAEAIRIHVCDAGEIVALLGGWSAVIPAESVFGAMAKGSPVTVIDLVEAALQGWRPDTGPMV